MDHFDTSKAKIRETLDECVIALAVVQDDRQPRQLSLKPQTVQYTLD